MLPETNYGPSGIPHVNIFYKVARTYMVHYAFQVLSDIPKCLYILSNDIAGLHKIPGNVPNQGMLKALLGKPLTQIADPFEKYESSAHYNDTIVPQFLDSFSFDYEFQKIAVI